MGMPNVVSELNMIVSQEWIVELTDFLHAGTN